jgi:ankyrin repeat protein
VINEQGTTPLFGAVWTGKRSIASFLLEHGKIEIIIQKITCVGADINLSKAGGWKPIHAATYNSFEKLTKFLIEKAAQLSEPCMDTKNYTPLRRLNIKRKLTFRHCYFYSKSKLETSQDAH